MNLKVGDVVKSLITSSPFFTKGFLYSIVDTRDSGKGKYYVIGDHGKEIFFYKGEFELVRSVDFSHNELSGDLDPPIFVDDNGKVTSGIAVKNNQKVVSDGGPSTYYDFLSGWKTLNDMMDYKAEKQWKGLSFHLGNVQKAIFRWGEKDGTTVEYDAKKIIYSGCRVLLMLTDKATVRKYLQSLLDDEQFK